jgi:uncharacterized membrane protein/protein-disulfide isomerase
MRKSKQIIPLPIAYYLCPIAFFAFTGLANSIYLAISHYRVYTDLAYKSFCAISKSINCDTVSQSPYSILIGIPVPVWGIIGYAFFLLLLCFAWNRDVCKQRLWTTLFILSLSFSIYSIVLAYISTFIIHSYCLMCIVSYGINFLLLYYTWLIRKRFDKNHFLMEIKMDFLLLREKRKTTLTVFLSFIGVLVFLFIFSPSYWIYTSPVLSKATPSGTTVDGHPWIGAVDPELTITEFADYQCFQCKKMHFYLRKLVAQYPDKLRLVHRHFPMDHTYNPLVKEPFHIGSAKMAILSLYAAEKNKFWGINEILFNIDKKKGNFNIRSMAQIAGFDVNEFARSVNDKSLQYKLKVDIWDGIKLGVTGTPAYLINNDVYIGHVPAELINRAIK